MTKLVAVEIVAQQVLSLREQRVMVDADLAGQLSADEKTGVVTNCDHPGKLKYSRTLRYALYRSHAPRGNVAVDALRPRLLATATLLGRGAPEAAFPRGAWGRSILPARGADKNLPSDRTTSHSTKLANNASQVAGYVFCHLPSERGISLVELIMFIVIVSVALAGVMLVMNTTAMYSADPLVHKQALTVAESLLEEIELQVFTPGGFSGPFDQANRHRFDDIMDYSYGFATTGVYPASGTAAVSGLQNYNVTVAVSAVNWGNISSASAVQITVAVTDPMSQAVSAIGYRVAY